MPLIDHAMVPFDDGQIIIGGNDIVGGYDGEAQRDIHLFSCSNRSCSLTTMAQKLTEGRTGHIAILVDDDLTKCEYPAVK